MEYKVVPFVASIDRAKNTQKQVAEQLEDLIQNQTNLGWEYVRLESVTSFVNPINGCFGIGAQPGFTTHRQMAVFRK
ncbi:hypothetical protein POV27_01600 [Aureisphaera galaxeae]|uniref:hypothetical protein n=1 Tax=Aureisphaera galaxeae TaxID=1538023 RepID=UPI002350DECB|nr:hypothetical protein [Aureisphaera galaxeae]MDC8002734.1 hypothetical protein [Aureisphaera galaxeae]